MNQINYVSASGKADFLIDADRRFVALTNAQARAMSELLSNPEGFRRTRDGWKTPSGRFVPLIVISKLIKRRFAMLVDDRTGVVATLFGKSAFEETTR